MEARNMRQILLGLAGAAVVGLGAFGAQPAQAQGFSITIGTPGYYRPAPIYRPYPRYRPVYYRPAPVYRPYPRYRPVHYRPAPIYRSYGPQRVFAPPVDYGPVCTTRVARYWDGFGYVSERRKVCR
jgi:hypothetical protein